MPSRQEAYRLRKLKDGLCTKCGQRQLVTVVLCEVCRVKMKIRFARNLARLKLAKHKASS